MSRQDDKEEEEKQLPETRHGHKETKGDQKRGNTQKHQIHLYLGMVT